MRRTTRLFRSDGPLWQFLSSPQGKALALTTLIVLTAGCSGLTGGDGGGGQGAPLEDIPEGVDSVMHMESGFLQDSTTEELMNGLIEMDTVEETEMTEDQPENWDEVLQEFENETELSVSGFHSVTFFGKSERLTAGTGMTSGSQESSAQTQEYGGMIMQTDWTWEEMVEATDMDQEFFSEQTYNGVTVYVNESVQNVEQVDEEGWLADMGDGKFVFGPKQVVQDVIDTNQGDSPAFSGEVRETYESATDGYMKAVVNVTEQQTAAATGAAGGGMGMGTESLSGTEMVTMVYHTGIDEMTFEMEMQMQTEKQAQEFAELKSLLGMMAGGEGPATAGENPAAWAVETLEFEQNGNTVSMSFGASPQELLDLFEGMNEGQSSGTDFSIDTRVAG